MKKSVAFHNTLLKVLALVFVFALAGCDDDDDEPTGPTKSSAKQILSFIFTADINANLQIDAVGDINEQTKEVSVSFPHGTDVSALSPTISISQSATISPASEVKQDFTNKVDYTVKAEDGSEKTYAVSAVIGKSVNSKIESFVFEAVNNSELSEDIICSINNTANTISGSVPYGTNLTALVPTVTFHDNASVSPKSAVAQNFSSSVTYTVTAQAGNTRAYVVDLSIAGTGDALILSEGNFQTNNSSLTHYDIKMGVANQNFFEKKIGRLLGDTGNDMILAGDILYVVVNNSHKLEVINTKTWTSVKNISILKGGVGADPREIVEHNGKLFVTCYDKQSPSGYVAVIDTANNYGNAIQWLEVGESPEGLTVLDGKIYVANSNYDFDDGKLAAGSVSIIDVSAATPIVIETIKNVGYNISSITADSHGDLYVVSRGNYGDIAANLYVLNSSSKTVTSQFDITAQQIKIVGNDAYVSVGGYDKNWNYVAKVVKIDVATEKILNQELINSSHFQTLYSIDVEPVTGDIYCLDARSYSVSGDAIVFDKNGQKKTTFKTGINPCKVIFLGN